MNSKEYYKYLARPKSANLIDPLLSMRRFWGFKSRCRTRWSWQYAIPSSNWRKSKWKTRMIFFSLDYSTTNCHLQLFERFSGNPGHSLLLSKSSMCFLRSMSRYSNTKYNFWSAWITSVMIKYQNQGEYCTVWDTLHYQIRVQDRISVQDDKFVPPVCKLY